ncbi:pyridoxal phosphate-dependent aminotransferase [Streptomyces sp. NPDC046909]|uniref:pyridoxal phosphate-dependent aminotransferase n=1 Tax=Streptomyces sp. NPDC046909 TaxID=3155617 RepID=UPI0033FD91B4
MTTYAAAPVSTYPMRRWVFEDAAGNHDIDLGDSNLPPGTLDELASVGDLELDYGHNRGIPRLRALVAGLYGTDEDNILVTHGAQQALYLVYTALLRPGDQVITFRPGWQQSWDMPAELGAQVDVLGHRPDLSVDVEAAAAVAGDRLRLIVVNSPCNPTGRRISDEDLAALHALTERTGAYLLLDEDYAIDLAESAALRLPRTFSVSSLSKVYGYPGLRVGWLYGPAELVAACTERKFLSNIGNSVLCETLACDVLERREHYTARYRELTTAGLDVVRDWAARNTDAVELVEPQGTPFAWFRLLTGEAPLDLCRRALALRVLLMPGETLGASDGFRLCFAREPDQITEGLRRIDTVLRPRASHDAVHDPTSGAV